MKQLVHVLGIISVGMATLIATAEPGHAGCLANSARANPMIPQVKSAMTSMKYLEETAWLSSNGSIVMQELTAMACDAPKEEFVSAVMTNAIAAYVRDGLVKVDCKTAKVAGPPEMSNEAAIGAFTVSCSQGR